jgi:hypothetical protein
MHRIDGLTRSQCAAGDLDWGRKSKSKGPIAFALTEASFDLQAFSRGAFKYCDDSRCVAVLPYVAINTLSPLPSALSLVSQARAGVAGTLRRRNPNRVDRWLFEPRTRRGTAHGLRDLLAHTADDDARGSDPRVEETALAVCPPPGPRLRVRSRLPVRTGSGIACASGREIAPRQDGADVAQVNMRRFAFG